MTEENIINTVKWVESWEKNFESSLKAIKRFKEDLDTRPTLPPTTEKKFQMYLDLLTLELNETSEQFRRK